IETRGAAKLTGSNNVSADVGAVNKLDGFSRTPVLVFSFPVEMSPEGFTKISADPTTAGNTVVADAETGELIPHWADLDPRATDKARQAISIHPVVALKESHRYVVGVRNVHQA